MEAQADRTNLVKVAAGSALSLVLVQLILIVYKAYFGPLSKFPGPKLHALTPIINLYYKFKGLDVVEKRRLHDTYGPVVRFGPNEISFNTADGWRQIYGHRVGGKASLQKDLSFYGEEPITGTRSIIDADDENHARMRRILSHSFSDKALKDQEPVFKEWTQLLIKKLHEHASKNPNESTDMVKRWNCATFDIMGDLTFAESLGMLEGGEYSPWVKTIYDNIKIGTQLRCLFLLPVLGGFFRSLVKAVPAARQAQLDHLSYAVERVQRRMAKTELAHEDLWTEVIKRGEKLDMSMGEMESNGNIFMIAGTETTATLLSGLLFYLLKNPDKMAKLTKEVRETFDKTSDITIEQLQKMPYLNACIEEGLRIYPPVPIGLPRIVPPQGMAIDGVFVPGGTSVSVSQWAAYRSKDNFAVPEEFHPERWLSDRDEKFAKDDKAAFQPFSTGPRNCIGKNLAYHESRLLLASVLCNFDIELDPRSNNWHGDQMVFNLWEKLPLWVKLRPVKA
ncbi:cytochrome P450 monooxygenase-like protein 24 [Elsinoe australis]|uniref:Cytochrome P450 monooxygenase-like protein 24 n=1 Tax=Elsinoe australis TaxID=40998 RepID=A0A4U7AYU1_9PEZI|nr:cytochrome P450 monooxygenase-like protein 24 [Elsinoe australis]